MKHAGQFESLVDAEFALNDRKWEGRPVLGKHGTVEAPRADVFKDLDKHVFAFNEGISKMFAGSK